MFWCAGLYILCLVAYLVRTWNTLQLVLACPTVLLFLYFWYVGRVYMVSSRVYMLL
ncbi:hypothetical protein DPMN_053277 [Dreissena polymorpha]|uniref:Uncharacterized protein n=1 Tax=Dreissena polymorpha TaxID=45954 RepID=A0A9D4CN07_DREPO|nr:hypothetical protein DPMN_053277 [Dreissena polymorpha]